AVARGDLTQKITVDVRGEVLELKNTINTMVDQLSGFADEVTRVATEVGTEGRLGGQALVPGVAGTWKHLTESVNSMARNLTSQVRDIAQVTTAVANGDLSQKISVEAKGEVAALAETINRMVDQLSAFADEVTRVAREVGTDGKLGGQAVVAGVAGTWKDLTDSVNFMAGNLTAQVRDIARVTTAVARGDLGQVITVDVKGEVAELKDTINTMVSQLSSFAAEVTRVAREVGTDGKLGGQAEVTGVSGTWRDLTESVNLLAGNLTAQVRNIAQVTTAVAEGDLSQKISVEARGEVATLRDTINKMVDQLRSFAAEVSRVAREVGTEGRLGGQAQVEGVSGTWHDLTHNVNQLAGNLTAQVRNIAQVTTAVAEGDLSQKITVDARGEVLALKNTINTMVDQLSSFADEVTRVAREVGTEGRLGGQARVAGVSGTWRDLTDNVNFMARNLTDEVRNIAQVTTAVANGDLTQTVTVDARGEVAELKDTINRMVAQLSSFAAEVTRVAREVGTDGKLGGQARVAGVSGTWKDLTENVNQLAGNLTTQVRSIAEVSTAVTQGDLTRRINVEAAGEVAELKDNINQMIANLRETTLKNAEQDWLKSNLARTGGLLQGQRNLEMVCQLIMSELTPSVAAQHGAMYVHKSADGGPPELSLIAHYGASGRLADRFQLGESLVGQAALDRRRIRLDEAPPDYVEISSGLGHTDRADVVILPALFEEDVLAVIELASLHGFTDVHLAFLDQFMETVGVVLNTIMVNERTEDLLAQSQLLTQELQQRSVELQQTNEELAEKARLLELRNRDIEVKNREIESAQVALQDRAEQLALSSKYKSEFLANMSHELRTPLNSLLILARLLAEDSDASLTPKQVDYARTIYAAGTDLLNLISDILDLSKVEAGKMQLHPTSVPVRAVIRDLAQTFGPTADQKGIDYDIVIAADAPESLHTDEQRLQQVLRNLLSNAFKFTERGRVCVGVERASHLAFTSPALQNVDVVAFRVADTGVGVPADKLRLIFEAFQQADGTTSRRFGGTGLGLSISREITNLLGGELHVESEVGVGSTFTLYLPVTHTFDDSVASTPWADLAADQRDERPWEPARRVDRRDEAPPIVLYGSPERGPLPTVVRAGGFTPIMVASGDEAIEVIRRERPVAIALVAAPGLDAAEVLVELKRRADVRHLPVHVFDEEGVPARWWSAGAAFVHSAATDDEVRAMLDQVASLRSRHRQVVLVVDPDDQRRHDLVSLLGDQSISVVGARGTAEAVAILGSRTVHCVVVDQDLDDELVDLLDDVGMRQLDDGSPVALVTVARGHVDAPIQERLERLALSRPVRLVGNPQELFDATALFLHRAVLVAPVAPVGGPVGSLPPDPVLEGRRVLIVDDDPRNLFAISSVLESQGMEVLIAENGQDGIDVLTREPAIELVLMDIMMPGMDGYSTMEVIRRQEAFVDLPIIAVTAKAMVGDREKAISAGASDYVTKPVEIDMLLEVMHRWLDR
ncbi:MAG TPA: HAMP domain-containing protein, partial [Ilumatobacteraceae bacterium]